MWILLLFIFSTSFSFSNGISHPHLLQRSPTLELADDRISSGVVEWNTRRFLDEASNESTTLILAANRTHRRDPINGFKYYEGGWNITSQHYISSLVFSSAPLFIIATIWLVLFGICLCCICLRRCFCCCCRKEPYGYSRTAYAVSLIFLVLLTLAAIVGSVFLYTGQGKLQTSTINGLAFILKHVDTTVQNLMDLFNYLLGAKKIGVGQASLPAELMANIDKMQGEINGIAGSFRNVTEMKSENIRNFINPLVKTLITVNAAMLVLASLGFFTSYNFYQTLTTSATSYNVKVISQSMPNTTLDNSTNVQSGISCLDLEFCCSMLVAVFSILGLECLVYFLIIIGWLAVVATFILSGVFLLVHNAVADTCVAMDEWQKNPTANSALEDLIPRVSDSVARDILIGTKGVTFGLVNVTNTAITNVYNVDFPPDAGPLYSNQSGPLMPVLCNPFDSNLTERHCATGEVDFKNASEVWKSYVCQVSASGICTTPGRVTPNTYNQLTVSLNVSFGLYHYGPFLVDLVDSTYLKEILSDMSKTYCPNMRQSTKWTYAGFTVVSTAIMLSLILWIIYARERKHRKYTKKLMTGPYGSPSDGFYSNGLKAR